MRILWWTGSFWPVIGGPQVAGARLVEGLRARGHEVVVLADSADDHLPERDALRDVPIRRWAFVKTLRAGEPRGVADLSGRVGRVLAQFEPDVIHLNAFDATALFCTLALQRCPVPLLITQHALFAPSQPLGPDTVLARLFARAARVACVSRAVLDDVCRAFPSVRPRATARREWTWRSRPCRRSAHGSPRLGWSSPVKDRSGTPSRAWLASWG
jgi:nucleoside-diphosphate-sugar epimerase